MEHHARQKTLTDNANPLVVGKGVAAGAGELAVGEGLLAGLGERDQMDAAESEFAFAAADDEALDPASGAGTLDVEVESVAVSVPTDGRGADEGGGEPVVGVSALGLVRRGVGALSVTLSIPQS